MKKTLCMLLALILMLALLPAAYAEFEPVEGTPYSLPLLEKPEDFDLEAVISGHTLKRLLDLVDNIQSKQAMKQVAQGQEMNMEFDDYYFLDDGQYVSYSIQNPKGSKNKTYQLFLFDKEDPTYYSKSEFGRDKYTTDPAIIDVLLEGPIFPFDPNTFDFEITELKEEEDGLFTCAFNGTAKPEFVESFTGDVPEFSDCSLSVDPETGLVRAYTYSMKTDDMEVANSGEINYNVDQEPDYSLKY